MKCIILAAGYATRLYPITKDRPKSLLEVAGISILNRILQKVEKVLEIDEIIIVTNHKFYNQFFKWSKKYCGQKAVSVLDDGTIDNENRLGAIRDIAFCIEKKEIEDDLMVLAGDNLFDFELTDFVDFFKEKDSDCITTHIIEDTDRLQRTGVAEFDRNFKLLSFEEKPKNPKSRYAVPPFYIYKRDTLSLIKKFIDHGNDGDAPGMFICWLLNRRPIYAFFFNGNRYDIGTLDSYQEVQKIFE
jgi:glucose-1-phosphate thymidylyltransferase